MGDRGKKNWQIGRKKAALNDDDWNKKKNDFQFFLVENILSLMQIP